MSILNENLFGCSRDRPFSARNKSAVLGLSAALAVKCRPVHLGGIGQTGVIIRAVEMPPKIKAKGNFIRA